jgi:hypothetical protein
VRPAVWVGVSKASARWNVPEEHYRIEFNGADDSAKKGEAGESTRFSRKEDESNSANPKRAIYNSDNYLDMEVGRSMDR